MGFSYSLLPLIPLAAAMNCRFGLTYCGASLMEMGMPYPLIHHSLNSAKLTSPSQAITKMQSETLSPGKSAHSRPSKP